MKNLVYIISIGLVLIIQGESLAQYQGQNVDGYTLVRSSSGTLVCVGKWIPPRDVALPGTCDGQLVDANLLAAVSSRLTADRLDQILNALSLLDQKLAINNEQIKQLIDSTIKTQVLIDQQVNQVSDLLSEAITARFETLPEQILTNELFRKELEKLKEDILKEVEKHYLKRPMPERK